LKEIRIFYSWQSDSEPEAFNHYLIEQAIEKAVKKLKQKEFPDIDFSILQDARDIPGSPDIAKAVFEKIDNCHIFIGDVSIINPEAESKERKTPNPNVLIELGYAAKYLGWGRVIFVCNTLFGQIEELPFDIRGKSSCSYKLGDNETKAEVRENLAMNIASRLKRIINVQIHKSISDMAMSLLEQIKNNPRSHLKGLTLNTELQGGYCVPYVLYDFENFTPIQEDLLDIEESIQELVDREILIVYYSSESMTWYLLHESIESCATIRAESLLEEIQQGTRSEDRKGVSIFCDLHSGKANGDYVPYFHIFSTDNPIPLPKQPIIETVLAAEKLVADGVLRRRDITPARTVETVRYVLRKANE
jgi:hypothetical protein